MAKFSGMTDHVRVTWVGCNFALAILMATLPLPR